MCLSSMRLYPDENKLYKLSRTILNIIEANEISFSQLQEVRGKFIHFLGKMGAAMSASIDKFVSAIVKELKLHTKFDFLKVANKKIPLSESLIEIIFAWYKELLIRAASVYEITDYDINSTLFIVTDASD